MYIPPCGGYSPWQASAGRRNQREARLDRAADRARLRRQTAADGTPSATRGAARRRASGRGAGTARTQSTRNAPLPAVNESALSALRRDQFRVGLGGQVRQHGRAVIIQRIRQLADGPLPDLTAQARHDLRAYLVNLEERIRTPQPAPHVLREGLRLWILLRVDVSTAMWARLRQLIQAS